MSRYIFILLLLLMCSCHKDEKFNDEKLTAVSVSLRSNNGQIAVPGGSNYTRSVDYVMVPVQVVLSAAAPKIFTVDIGVNNDTVTQLINSQQLPGAILLDEAFYQLPRSAEIRFGIDTFT
ncbi:MAG TPA: hypothetical protein VJ720_10020, partial [Chitinophaga sp.]|nr:hypothetical protein [Chitinophaga sp.]